MVENAGKDANNNKITIHDWLNYLISNRQSLIEERRYNFTNAITFGALFFSSLFALIFSYNWVIQIFSILGLILSSIMIHHTLRWNMKSVNIRDGIEKLIKEILFMELKDGAEIYKQYYDLYLKSGLIKQK